jgi:hypothetical protein
VKFAVLENGCRYGNRCAGRVVETSTKLYFVRPLKIKNPMECLPYCSACTIDRNTAGNETAETKTSCAKILDSSQTRKYTRGVETDFAHSVKYMEKIVVYKSSSIKRQDGREDGSISIPSIKD